ncbi:unnamed protein product [Orchesella dallaii]|uniref:Uncharacterized protein n=1 Tax=Orchesella dallaii TaxID=48710 RepID=A0ABP1RQS8_9HEXA
MAVLILGAVHNLTISLYPRTNANWKNVMASSPNKGPEMLSGSASFATTNFYQMFVMNKLTVVDFDSRSIYYCQKLESETENNLKFRVWLEPFTTGIWMGILAIVIYAVVCSFIQHRQNVYLGFITLMDYIGNVFGASVKSLSFLISVCAVSFLLNQIYGNGLTSVITVVLPPKGIKSLKELLSYNYKIAFDPSEHSISVEDYYGPDFNAMNLSVENSFVVLNKSENIYGRVGRRNVRLAMLATTSDVKMNVALMSKYLEQIDPSFTCFTLDETVNKIPVTWFTKTENQEWLKTSLQRIVESGLYRKWEAWATWYKMLVDKLMVEAFKPTSDSIDVRKFAAVFTSWAVETPDASGSGANSGSFGTKRIFSTFFVDKRTLTVTHSISTYTNWSY